MKPNNMRKVKLLTCFGFYCVFKQLKTHLFKLTSVSAMLPSVCERVFPCEVLCDLAL